MAGLHRGRINLSTGLLEPYLVIDLPTKDKILADDAFVPSSMDQDTLQRIYKVIKVSSNPILSYKIDCFLDRLKVYFHLRSHKCLEDHSHMGQFPQDGIFSPQTSKIWSSSRTAADYKIDLPNIFLASFSCDAQLKK